MALISRARFFRFALNIWPCIYFTGGRIIYIAPDFRILRVKLPLSWRTLNRVGTIFGGSMYASTDPMYMLMLMEILGHDYVVWDKGCTIRFRKPATETLFIQFEVTDEMLNDVKKQVTTNGEYTFTWSVAYKDKKGVVHVEFDKVLYVATKAFYKEKLAKRKESKNESK